MNKKIFGLASFLLIFGVLFSSYAYALDVSIDRVRVNGDVVAESKTNLINDANVFSVLVEFTAVQTLEKGHVEAILRGRQSGDTVSDSTSTFDLAKNQSSSAALTLVLIDSLKRETEFDLTIKFADVKGGSEQKTYTLKTKRTTLRGALDVSIDRVRVNSKIVAASRTNFIDESNDFDVLVEFTALEDLEDAHAEAILKDLRSGNVVADASPNFDLSQDSSFSILLRLELLDKLKDSNSFELTVKIIDAEGDSVQELFGIAMRDGNGKVSGNGGRDLDISINSIEAEGDALAENENNFLIIDEGEKKLNLRVRLTSLENVEDAHVDAVLAFENGDVVADATLTFDIADGESTVKDLELPLIGKFEQNSFKLKVKVVDAEGDSEEKLYGLKLSQVKFPFVISSISLSPDNAEAGKNLIARLSLKNIGVMPLDGINAKVSIPELGISSTKFVGQIKNTGSTEIREDFILKILDSTPTGTYTLKSEVFSQFGGESEVKELPVFILGKSEQGMQTVNDRLVINVPIVKQDIHEGSEAIYPFILTNEGPDANTYVLLLDGASWADLMLRESNAFVIKPKESKTVNVHVTPKAGERGEQIFFVTVKSSDRILKQIPLKGNVVASKGMSIAKLGNIFGIALMSIAILLVAMGLFFGVRKYLQGKNSEEIPDKANGESYY